MACAEFMNMCWCFGMHVLNMVDMVCGCVVE